ncbi:ABC-three component system protein [Lacrimispora sp.]|uniref:ABC-three component system protein n=1 Tax=Lacrimispora sp. TaxID=2719234 RepID=UPI00289C585A|nr:ABC-three component system protein [Lacrimispora sp.]
MSEKTHVPDKLQGYTLQVRHMLYELISLDLERIVSVEAFEDVGIEENDYIIAEQLKSSLSNNSPISDRSVVFWKTIYNWCKYIECGALLINKTIFKFVVVANHNVTPGAIAMSFKDAATVEEADMALTKARDKLWGKELEKKKDIPNTYEEYLEYIFDTKRKNIVIEIIKTMQFEVFSQNYDEELRKKFSSQAIPLEYEKELFLYMLGWVYDKVNDMTKDGRAAFIQCKDFRDALLTQIRCYDLNTILAAVSTQPSDMVTKMEMDKHDVYLKQLDLIELEAEVKLRAASDVLRTKTEKTEWAERGIVAVKSFDNYEESLKRLWNNGKAMLPFLVGIQDNVHKGQALYTICQRDVASIKVQGKEIPEFFGPGFLNLLANEPVSCPKIGWHPNYKKLLEKEGDKDE